MLVESIRAATHQPAIRFKTDVTEARQRIVDLAVAEVRKKAEQGEKLVDWLRSYFIKEGFDFSVSSTPERVTVMIKW